MNVPVTVTYQQEKKKYLPESKKNGFNSPAQATLKESEICNKNFYTHIQITEL